MKTKLIIYILISVLLLCFVLPTFSFLVHPVSAGKFTMDITSEKVIGTWFDGYWEYKYTVHIKSTDTRVRVDKIKITKTKGAKVYGAFINNQPSIGWTVRDMGNHFIMQTPFVGSSLSPCTKKTFRVVSAENEAQHKAEAWDKSGAANTNGPQAVKAPNTPKKKQAQVLPSFDGITYKYVLSSLHGDISQMVLVLSPQVTLTNIASSDPEWTWYRPDTGEFSGMLYFGTFTKPLSPGDAPVTLSFSSPNPKGTITIVSNFMGIDAPGPYPAPPVVGGTVIPVNKLELLIPWIALATVLIFVAAVTLVFVKRRRKQ